MNFNRISLLAVILTASLSTNANNNANNAAAAFSPTTPPSRNTPLHYRTSPDETALPDESLLNSVMLPRVTTSASRASSRPSPVLSLESMADCESAALDPRGENFDKVTILRFHAPWCKVCQTTSVAYERLAAKMDKASSSSSSASASASARGVRFASANLTPKNPRVGELKEWFEVEGVPMGVFLHRGEVIGKVTLNRGNLSELKNRLEGYLEGTVEVDGLLEGLMYSAGSDDAEVKAKVKAKESFVMV
mmetsp:Transcript_8385/g.17486  ORF Transcript_8385/g.17486 Transcript_8385/m.17486 type:complete len:250 (-) Transcript_8385:172-921(-)